MTETSGKVGADPIPDLEAICPSCKGEGRFSDNPPHDFTDCFKCDGAGYVPTESGKKVLNLMRHNFRTMASKIRFGIAD